MLAKSGALPDVTRGYVAMKTFRRHFERLAYNGDETDAISGILKEHKNWPVFDVQHPLPSFFDGKQLHFEVSYPSQKNLRRLFNKLGMPNLEAKLSAILRRDVDVMIEGFQSVRTALAHAAPPPITIRDVRMLIGDMQKLVGAIDRVFYYHVLKHGGGGCWK